MTDTSHFERESYDAYVASLEPCPDAYVASLEPCPECGRVDEMDNIEGKLLCASCYLDENDDGCDVCGAYVDAEGACENCWGVDDAR